MSLIRGWQQNEVRDFLGAWTDVEPTDVPSNRALAAENVDYFPGQVRIPRFGFSTIQSPGDAIVSLENWVHSYNNVNYNLLAYLASAGSTGINLLDLSTSTKTFLYNPTGSPKGAVFVPAGSRLYMCTFTNQNFGTDKPRVYIKEFQFSSNPNTADPIYPALPSLTPTAVQSGGGINTLGTRILTLVMQSRSGFTTAPGIGNLQITFNVATVQEIVVTFTPTTTWPNWISTATLVSTTTDNLNKFYLVPGSTFNIAALAGTSTPFNLIMNMSDDDLAATGTDATPYFSIFSPVAAPSFMMVYGSRMVYINHTDDSAFQSVMYVSEPNDYQHLTADQNTIYLPGQAQMVSAFTLYNTLYIVGPHWTHQTADTGDVPATWAQPLLVDGKIGTLSPLGTSVNASQGFAWIADVAGLYLFIGGAYSSRPISYYNADQWRRINWAAATTIKVIDDTQNKKVRVFVPLDAAITPSHILTWDYSRGLTPEMVSFSLDSIQSYALGTGAMVQNDTTKRIETWIAPNDTTKSILRQTNDQDTHPYRDGTQAILPVFETALQPMTSANVLQHHGDHLRLQGGGNLKIRVKSLDGGRNVDLTQVLGSASPAALILRRYHMLSEAVSIRFTMTDLDANAVLSMFTHYFTPWVTNR